MLTISREASCRASRTKQDPMNPAPPVTRIFIGCLDCTGNPVRSGVPDFDFRDAGLKDLRAGDFGATDSCARGVIQLRGGLDSNHFRFRGNASVERLLQTTL